MHNHKVFGATVYFVDSLYHFQTLTYMIYDVTGWALFTIKAHGEKLVGICGRDCGAEAR